MLTRYDAAYYGLSPVALPMLAWRWARRGKYRRSAGGMLGRDLPTGAAAETFVGGSVWIHAVSVGEVAAARAIEPGLRALFPGRPFVISTVTETGQDAARRALPGAEAHTFFPVDLSWNVNRFLDAFRPRVVVLLEAEIWPNFLTLAARRGASVFLINGRLSDRSFPRYRFARGVMRPVFDSFRGFCVQTAEDARRYGEIGVERARIAITGNCKFDLRVEPLDEAQKAELKRSLGVAPERPAVVAGSTHPGEEGMILDAFAEVRRAIPDACLVLAPRHPERFGDAFEIARSRGASVARASDPGGVERPEVVILDKMGELARAYGAGEIAIVAGSFGRVGGHNLLEAAAHAVPVIYGPNMKSQREIAQLFRVGRAGTQVEPGALAETMLRFLQDPDARREAGVKCRAVLEANQGSADRAVRALRRWVDEPGARNNGDRASTIR
jgi:3-deoxy-D-manno-octulosonic-acid transferase